jgi:S1-C subfamily serine protease
MLEYFYGYKGGQSQEQVGTGSGVIISADGYIVTNNHVVKMLQVEITLNNKSHTRLKLIGTDSKMDISLKNDADETLPIALLVIRTPKVGEWVLL